VIALRVGAAQIIEQGPPQADHLEQATPRTMILDVGAQMLVNSLMRVVSRAICTSADPVSFG